MKSKSVVLEMNEANDGDNNSNVNLTTIAAVKIATITNEYNRINNKKINKNINNNGNNDKTNSHSGRISNNNNSNSNNDGLWTEQHREGKKQT